MSEASQEAEILANLEKAILGINKSANRGVTKALEFVKVKAIPKTPLDEGPLRASYFVKVGKRWTSGVIVNTAPYALEQHENLEYFHPHGEAKFLERAVMQNLPAIGNIITGEMKL